MTSEKMAKTSLRSNRLLSARSRASNPDLY